MKNALISEQAERGFSASLFGVIRTASAIGSASGPAVFDVLATEWDREYLEAAEDGDASDV